MSSPQVQALPEPRRSRGMEFLRSPFNEMLLGAVIFLAAGLSFWMTRSPDGIALFWPGSAIAAALLIRRPQVRWRAAAISVLLALLLANVMVGHRLWGIGAIFAGINGAEIALMVVAFRFVRVAPYPNISISHAAVMTVVLGIVIPGLSAVAAGFVLRDHFGVTFARGALQWWSSHAIGACLLAPPIILFSRPELGRLTRREFLVENALTFVLGLAGCYLAIRYVRFPFVSIGLLLLVAAFRLGGFGTSVMSLAFGLLITNLWLIGIRPLGLDPVTSMSVSLIGLPVIALLATVMPPIAVGLGSDARRAAVRALRDSQNFLARTGAAAGVGGWELNLATGKLTWSDETRRLHDVSPDFEPTLENALGFYTEQSKTIVRRALNDAIEHQTPWDLELELVSAAGRIFWARATGTVEFDNGTAARLVGAFQDITEKRRLVRELAESYELVRVTLDSIGDAVITTDREGLVQWLNPVAEAMTGWTKSEAHSKPLVDVFNIVHAESRQPSLNPVAICLAEGKAVGLQSNTTLISRMGAEFGIEDSTSPIRNADGQILGAVLVFHDVTEQRRLSREMSHRAAHDALTGLVNRAEFEVRLSRLLAGLTLEGTSHVLMYIDLDQFKVVNDACGHSAGDQLLRQVSAVLQGCVRGRDTVARLGGDEFGVLLENCGIEQGQTIGRKICEQMESYRFAHDGRRYRVGTSIGVVPVDVRWGSSAAVMQAADSCCFAAKEAGRNRVHLWVESDSALQVRQGEMQWVNRLEAAMDDNRFTLFAQHVEPICGPGGGLHCEVLLRLVTDDGAVIAPGAFLPSAERFHLAARIDRWVVQRVFSHLEAEDTTLELIETISVNLSGHSVGDRAFHRELMRMLRAASFDVRKLCFEITETAAITHLGDAKVFIEEVRSLGVRIALDDFGAGASSFGYLRTLPVDYIKIDGQFISGLLDDPLDNAAVRCFCEVAKVVGVKTIAEFVERAETRAALRTLGVDFVQGYSIHRPEPFLQLLSKNTAASITA